MEAPGDTVNLLELLGLDQESFVWQDLALCARLPEPDIFFEKYERDKTIARQADQMCFACPVMKQCAQYAMETKQRGVWGGVYWNGAGEPDKEMNAHKTDEDWATIRERMSE